MRRFVCGVLVCAIVGVLATNVGLRAVAHHQRVKG